MSKTLGYISLFTSTSTLMCCALPSLLVVLSLGGALASFYSKYPIIGIFGEYSNTIFIIAGLLILFNVILLVRSQKTTCDITNREACTSSKSLSKYILLFSIVIYLISLGFKLSYLL